jgi:hypothetical protein
MTREEILALAGEPIAEATPSPNSYLKWKDGVWFGEGERIYTADQVLAACKRLEEEIERLHQDNDLAFGSERYAKKQLAAAQAEITRLPEDGEIAIWLEMGSPESFQRVDVSDMVCALKFFRPRLSDTSALEALIDKAKSEQSDFDNRLFMKEREQLVQKAGEVMRERCLFEADIAYHNKHCCAEIRAIPGVTLGDLQQ